MQLQWFRFLRAAIPVCVALPLCSVTAQQQPTDCHDVIGIPCSTIVYEHSQWQFGTQWEGWFTHHTSRDTIAHRSDGSSAVWAANGDAFLYVAPSDQVIHLNNHAKTISHRPPLIWHDRPFRRSKEGDGQCAIGIRHSGTDFHPSGDAVVAGIPVKKWERGDGWFWHEEEFLAPSLDCAALKVYQIRRNRWLIPLYSDSVEVQSVRLGEPGPSLFAVPTNYQEVKDPSEDQLREFVARNRSQR